MMKGALLLLVLYAASTDAIAADVSRVSNASGKELLSEIQKLLESTPPEGDPRVIEFLRSLTKDEILDALRNYGRDVEAETPPDRYGLMTFPVLYIMAGYPDPPRISAEELAKLPDDVQKDYRYGNVPGPLSDEAFKKLVAGIRSRNEGSFFRFALAGWAANDPGDTSPKLTKAQQERLVDTFLSVLRDRESPPMVRDECNEGALSIIQEAHGLIIYADDNLKEVLKRPNDPNERRDIKAVFDSGEIFPTAETLKQLRPWMPRIQEYRKTLESLRDDEREPQLLRDRATRTLAALNRMALVSTPEPPREGSGE